MCAHAPPGRLKKLGVIYREMCSKCTPGTRSAPQAEQESILGHFFAGRVRFGGICSSFRPSFEGDD